MIEKNEGINFKEYLKRKIRKYLTFLQVLFEHGYSLGE